ncbi:Secreted protein [Pseudomonas brassicacearum]
MKAAFGWPFFMGAFLVFISVISVTAAYGSALTAGHFWKSREPDQPKVTKSALPHHSAPRLGSVCPNEGIAPWVRVVNGAPEINVHHEAA